MRRVEVRTREKPRFARGRRGMARLVTQGDVDRFFAELNGKFSQRKWEDFVATLPDEDRVPRTYTYATRQELLEVMGEEALLLAEEEAAIIGVAIRYGETVPTDYVVVSRN